MNVSIYTYAEVASTSPPTSVMKEEIFLVFLACLSASVADKSDLNACTYTSDDGKVYDLSPLISTKCVSHVNWVDQVQGPKAHI